MSTVKTRNLVLDAANLIYEGSHAILYKAYTDNFGKPMYNMAVFAYWTSKLDGKTYEIWKKYATDCGAWGPDGLARLIESTVHLNDQAKTIHENLGDIEKLVRLCHAGHIGWHMIYDITGYYVNEKVGEYVGPNNHRGKVEVGA